MNTRIEQQVGWDNKWNKKALTYSCIYMKWERFSYLSKQEESHFFETGAMDSRDNIFHVKGVWFFRPPSPQPCHLVPLSITQSPLLGHHRNFSLNSQCYSPFTLVKCRFLLVIYVYWLYCSENLMSKHGQGLLSHISF